MKYIVTEKEERSFIEIDVVIILDNDVKAVQQWITVHVVVILQNCKRRQSKPLTQYTVTSESRVRSSNVMIKFEGEVLRRANHCFSEKWITISWTVSSVKTKYIVASIDRDRPYDDGHWYCSSAQ